MKQQSFFYGGKIILSPFDGWEETKRTETYFGKGKANIGANSAIFDLNRELINVEASAHYKGLFVQGEYFKFKDVVQDWGVNGDVTTGSSDGWYVTGEYVFTDFKYIAPFARYESWDRFEGKDGYDVTSTLAGINWYLRGNKDVTKMHITSQWFF